MERYTTPALLLLSRRPASTGPCPRRRASTEVIVTYVCRLGCGAHEVAVWLRWGFLEYGVEISSLSLAAAAAIV